MRYKEMVRSDRGLDQVFYGGEAVIETLEHSAARLRRPKSPLRPSRRLCRERASSRRPFSFGHRNRTKYLYDDQNRPIGIAYADGKNKIITYDGAGNVRLVTDRAGRVITHEYDDVNRLTRKFATGLQDDGSESTFQYDALGRISQARRVFRTDHTVEVNYRFDSLGRQVFEQQKIAGTNHDASISKYYTSTTLNRIVYPSGDLEDFAYDNLDRVRDVEFNLSPIATHKYLGTSRLARRSLMNGAAEVSRGDAWYDALGRTIAYINRKPATDAKQAWFEYGFDAAGNRLFRKEAYSTSCNADVYLYDAMNRLVGVKNGVASSITPGQIGRNNLPAQIPYDTSVASRYARTWDLDKQGSRRIVGTTPATGSAYSEFYNNVSSEAYLHGPDPIDRYIKVGSQPCVYDAAGNLTDDGTFLYSWDYENRLMSVTKKSDNSLVASFKYDAFGRRIEKVIGGGPAAVRYVYDGPNVIEERDQGNSVIATYVFGQGMDDVLAMNRGGSRYYYIRDAHGNITALTDSSGDVIERYRYGEYGDVEFLDGAGTEKSVTTSDYGNPLLFQARNFDSELGLYYFRARYCSPSLGRFLSHDPNGFADSMNLYQYCLENPINLSDPSGEIVETIWDIISIGVGIVSVAYDIYNLIETGQGWGNLAIDVGGLALDVGAAFLPGVPGGASVAIKASRSAKAASKAIVWGRRADFAINVGQSVYYGYEAYEAGDAGGMATSALGLGLNATHAGIRGRQLRSAPKGGQKLLPTPRESLLGRAQDPRLKNAIGELYRPRAKVGGGSAMDVYRYEQATGNLLSKSGHGQKLIERRTQLTRLMKDPSLSALDKRIAKDLLIDIQNALSGQ